MVSLFFGFLFALKAYDVYAKLYTAISGQYSVQGKITHSEYAAENEVWKYSGKYARKLAPENLITYCYYVDKIFYDGFIDTASVTEEEVKEKYYKDAEITVFYSPRYPAFSFINIKPTKRQVLHKAFVTWWATPFFIITGVLFAFWVLMNLK